MISLREDVFPLIAVSCFSVDIVRRYYAFDDDFERVHNTVTFETGYNETNHCRRIGVHFTNFHTCNKVHELGLAESNLTYLG